MNIKTNLLEEYANIVDVKRNKINILKDFFKLL